MNTRKKLLTGLENSTVENASPHKSSKTQRYKLRDVWDPFFAIGITKTGRDKERQSTPLPKTGVFVQFMCFLPAEKHVLN